MTAWPSKNLYIIQWNTNTCFINILNFNKKALGNKLMESENATMQD